ncbi:MAG: hypothetical protein RBT60_13505 [Candidatus Krumholzibacteria bacterium]|jgi:hypothetical protein|nr:hypothetical protein [Candidatus Krumholzibacteria bacterium]
MAAGESRHVLIRRVELDLAATQNQALSAPLFLYRVVLHRDLPWPNDLVRTTQPVRLPTVLTRNEVNALLGRFDGTA